MIRGQLEIAARDGAHGNSALIVDCSEEKALDLIVRYPKEQSRVEVLQPKALLWSLLLKLSGPPGSTTSRLARLGLDPSSVVVTHRHPENHSDTNGHVVIAAGRHGSNFPLPTATVIRSGALARGALTGRRREGKRDR